jgi:hypothetical protein
MMRRNLLIADALLRLVGRKPLRGCDPLGGFGDGVAAIGVQEKEIDALQVRCALLLHRVGDRTDKCA